MLTFWKEFKEPSSLKEPTSQTEEGSRMFLSLCQFTNPTVATVSWKDIKATVCHPKFGAMIGWSQLFFFCFLGRRPLFMAWMLAGIDFNVTAQQVKLTRCPELFVYFRETNHASVLWCQNAKQNVYRLAGLQMTSRFYPNMRHLSVSYNLYLGNIDTDP